MRRKFLIALVSLLWMSNSFADHERTPVPLVFASEPDGSTVFAMTPPRLGADREVTREAFGVAYRLDRNGVLKELYRTKGWYSFKVFVSADGRYLVQMGPRNKGSRPQKDHLAVAFHKDGKLLKRYSTAELMKNPDKVRDTVSYYEWLAPDPFGDLTELQTRGLQPGLDFDNRFTLHTLDGWTYVFDATRGEIKSVEATK